MIGSGLGASAQINNGLASCLGSALPENSVAIASNAAARNNAQGRVLQSNEHRNFVYLELSDDVRSALLSDGELRAGLVRCLVAGTET